MFMYLYLIFHYIMFMTVWAAQIDACCLNEYGVSNYQGRCTDLCLTESCLVHPLPSECVGARLGET